MVELHDAVVLVAERELARRAEHAVGDRAANLALLNLEAAGQHRARQRERIQLSRGDVGRAAHDVEQRAGARVDLRDVQMVGVRMRRFLDDARDDDRREIRRAARPAHRPSRCAR